MTETIVRNLIDHHVPPTAAGYAFQLWKETPFVFKVTRSRSSKVGDFTGCRHHATHRITVNHDLNPYLFLITYVHEVAHLRTFLHYGTRVEPHGSEWKRIFKNLLTPVLNEHVFPPRVLHRLTIHMANPKASSFADSELTIALRQYDPGAANQTTVADLPEGAVFKLQGKYYRKGKLRRTRVVCREIRTRREYLVPAEALVSEAQLSLLC
ncbi:MAG TPA: SprT-like domain-containing protein [Cyclobacteriaceae bacterium]|nr:SprT-like domain-containing protein [Cyclobacteriaceae bacterium]